MADKNLKNKKISFQSGQTKKRGKFPVIFFLVSGVCLIIGAAVWKFSQNTSGSAHISSQQPTSRLKTNPADTIDFKDLIGRWLGAQAGFKGVLIGCVIGGLVPGAPYAVFPLVATLYQAGAGVGAVVGFVSAWSLWSVSRLPVEMALIAPKPALVRYGITFVVPPLAGLLANAVTRLL